MAEKDYRAAHARRFAKSLEWIAPYADAAEKILDVGGESPFTAMLLSRWPGKLSAYYGGDLRHGFIVRDCDLVLAMEVLEHIEDCEHEAIQAEWVGTGTHNLLASCWMSLKAGGHLFLTTPNACSITAIHHALNLDPPALYRPHVREYSPYEVDEMVRLVGFDILRRETLDVWRNAITDKQYQKIADFIGRSGYPVELRGEDIFCLAQRPMQSKSAPE